MSYPLGIIRWSSSKLKCTSGNDSGDTFTDGTSSSPVPSMSFRSATGCLTRTSGSFPFQHGSIRDSNYPSYLVPFWQGCGDRRPGHLLLSKLRRIRRWSIPCIHSEFPKRSCRTPVLRFLRVAYSQFDWVLAFPKSEAFPYLVTPIKSRCRTTGFCLPYHSMNSGIAE